jgi:hypothetical protein
MPTITTSLDALLSTTGRDVSTSLLAGLDNDELEVFFSMDLEFDSGELNLWTGLGDITINSKTYTGTGNILQISEVEETAEIAAKGATITLSGIPSTLLSLALTEPFQGRVCTIYFGIISDTTDQTEIFSGYMDEMNIEESGETSTIELKVENKLIQLEKPGSARYTSAYQKSKFSGDLGLDFIEDLQDKRINWGRGES